MVIGGIEAAAAASTIVVVVVVESFLELFSCAVETFLLQVAHYELVELLWIHSSSSLLSLSLSLEIQTQLTFFCSELVFASYLPVESRVCLDDIIGGWSNRFNGPSLYMGLFKWPIILRLLIVACLVPDFQYYLCFLNWEIIFCQEIY